MNETAGCVLIVAHAPLASALRDIALHAFAECSANVHAVDIPADRTLAQAFADLRKVLDVQRGRQVLVLLDVLGATPGNALQSILTEYPNVRVAAGVNVPMLWRSLCYRSDAPEQWLERALAGGARGVQPLLAETGS